MSNVEQFRQKVTEYRTQATPYGKGKSVKQKELAEAIHLNENDLSRSLNGQRSFSQNEVRSIIRALADWGAITTRQQVEELITLMDCADFSPAQWGAAPLDQLEDKPKILNKLAKAAIPMNTNSFQNVTALSRESGDNTDETEITEAAPLLLGIVVDLSHSVLDTLKKTPNRSNISHRKLNEVFELIVRKIISFCKTDDSEEVLPKIALFVYGYGFGNLSQISNNIFQNIGLRTKKEPTLSEGVRDLFTKAANKEDLPITPTATDLNDYWPYYRKSIEAEFIDMELGKSILYECLLKVYKRFQQELAKPFYPKPILLIISDGQLHEAKDEQLLDIISSIQRLGVQVVCWYVTSKNIMKPKTLYAQPRLDWSSETLRLFNCSSIVTPSNRLINSITAELKKRNWHIPEQARLLIQVNQTELIEELTEAILNPLKDKD